MTAPAPAGPRTGWDTPRLLLAVVWVALLLSAFALREQPADLDTLYAEVAAGQVERVELVGGLPQAAGSGSVHLDVRWSADGDRRVARVLEVRGDAGTGPSDGRPPVTDDVEQRVRALDPDVQVTRTSRSGGWTARLLGVPLPGVLVPVLLAAVLATLLLLVRGPEPWRATRWAWFWLLAVPVGPLAFCLLSGPAPLLPAPRTDRRLTGGWAFLLSALLGGGSRA